MKHEEINFQRAKLVVIVSNSPATLTLETMACNRNYCLAFFLLVTFTTADDAAIMSKLSTAISPTPSNWETTTNFCDWEGISCDHFNRVTSINLPSKSLSGTLPADLNNLSYLRTLALQRNSLSGDLPTLANLTFLQQVLLDSNNFTSIPFDFFIGLTNLQSFSISDNLDLSPWNLPNYLTESTNLQTFQASNANVFGSIPDIFDNLQNLRLSYNNLTGTLPASFGGSEIQNLWIDNQLMGLSGTLDVISSMTQLSQVWLQANAFTGAIPDLSKCTNLFDLQLRDNQLTGLVPTSLTSLPKLTNVTLQNNKLQGPLPVFGSGVKSKLGMTTNSFCLATPRPCDPQVTALLEVAGALGYPMSLAESWQGNDACQDWIFVTCDSSGKNVTTVNFGKQKFTGTISPSFANLTSLRSLSLNENDLSGSIPEILTSLPDLVLFDVSNNNLSGSIPEFIQKVKFVHDNNILLGQNIPSGNITPPWSTPNSTLSDGSSHGQSKGSSVSVGMVIGIVISGVVFVGILLFVSCKCYGVPSKLHNQTSGDPSEMHVLESGNGMISVQMLLQATDNFNDKNVLGKGGFGVVYKGELHDGTKIAVKRMKCGVKGRKGMNQFQAEIGVLTRVRHRHLVALLGYCIDGDERLLVYEYMPQGTLSQHLFKHRQHQSPPLNWKQRVSVALDVARGVEYLHSLAQQCFIHRDLKPSNILLGDDMRAKVADFGLVRCTPDGKFSIETRLAGTFGYLAPEYSTTGRVTTKVDVYAFGIVLMELITGRKALDGSMPDESCHLVTWFREVSISKENMVEYIDQVIDTDDRETLESIFKVAELAHHCTAPKPSQRPDMGHAVNVLCPLVEQWKPEEEEEEESFNGHSMSLSQDLQTNEGSSNSIVYDVFQPNSV